MVIKLYLWFSEIGCKNPAIILMVVLGLFPFSKEMLKYISWGKRASLYIVPERQQPVASCPTNPTGKCYGRVHSKQVL